MLSVGVDLLVFLAGAAGLGALIRLWRTGPDGGSGTEASATRDSATRDGGTGASGTRGSATPGWRAIAFYTLAALAFFSPALLTRGHQISTDIAYQWRPWKEALNEPVVPENSLLADPVLQMLPFRELVRRRWLAGEPPLWANELGTGQPLLADAQSAPLAPLHLAALPLPTLRALTVAAAWQVVLGLLLMHALLVRLGASPAGRVLGALAFGFSTFSVVWAYYPVGMSAMWIPGVLLGLLRMADGAPRAAAGLVPCGLGLALSGHPETLAHTALAAAAVTVWLLVRGPRVGRGRLALRLAAAGALTFALAAPFLLPVLEALPGSERAGGLRLSPAGNDPPDFELRFAGFLVDPLIAGSPRGGAQGGAKGGSWTGVWNFNEQAGLYAGLVPLVLAVAGALVLRGRILAIVLGGLAALVAGFGIDPLHAWLNALPVFDQGAHGRLRLMWGMAVAIAAGLSLGPLLRRRAGRAVFALAMAAALGLLVALGTPPRPWLRLWWLTTVTGGLAVLAVPWSLWGAGRGDPDSERRIRGVFGAVAVAALALDLGTLGIRYNPVLPPEMALSPTPVERWLIERQREAIGCEAIQCEVKESPRGARPFRVEGEEWDLYPNVPALDGLWNVRGNDPARPMPPPRFVGLRLAGTYFPGVTTWIEPAAADPATEAFLGVRYRLTRHRRRWLPAPWRPIYRDQGGRVWENPRALPLFFFPERTEPVRPQSAEDLLRPVAPSGGTPGNPALEQALAIEDFSRQAVVEERGGHRRTSWSAQRGEVRIVALSGNRFDLELSTPTGGVVVSSVSHDPGWRLWLDGEPAPVLRANSAFLAFETPAGEHRARLVYSPAGWRWGLGLCALALACVGVPAAVRTARAWRRRRRVSARSTGSVTGSVTKSATGPTT